MRDEFFGDDHDFAKYDLLVEIVEKTPSLGVLTLVVMLTPNRNAQQGGRTSYEQGMRRSRIYEHLQDCVNSRNQRVRAVNELNHILNNYCDYRPYHDTPPHFFADATRQNYFDGIPNANLDSSLVFFDPDTGIETPNPNNMADRDEYLLWNDLAGVFGRATESTVFAVYQHYNFRATKLQKTAIFNEKASNLIQNLGLSCLVALSTDYTTMFVFSQSSQRMEHLSRLLMAYAAMHNLYSKLIFS